MKFEEKIDENSSKINEKFLQISAVPHLIRLRLTTNAWNRAYEFNNSSFSGETLVTKYSLVCKTSMIGSLRLTFNDKSP